MESVSNPYVGDYGRIYGSTPPGQGMYSPDSPGCAASPHKESAPGTTLQSSTTAKRTKVSRACDECRRKKTRCDADQPLQLAGRCCSSCRKSGTSCTFERAQLKRGPSKRPRSASTSSAAPATSNIWPPRNGDLRASPPVSQWSVTSPVAIPGVAPVPEKLPGINTLFSWQGQPSGTHDAHSMPDMGSGMTMGTGGGDLRKYSMGLPKSPLISQKSVAGGAFPHLSPMPFQLTVNDGKFPMLVEVACQQQQQQQQQHLQQYNNSLQHNSEPLSALHTDAKTAQVLGSYFKSWHDVFPILPSSAAELTLILHEPTVIAALAGSARSLNTEVPTSEPGRTLYLMALLFVYLHTLDYTWLGAACALAINNSDHSDDSKRLYAVVVALDRLHALTYHSAPLVGHAWALAKFPLPPLREGFERVLRVLELIPAPKQPANVQGGWLSPPPDSTPDAVETALRWVVHNEDPHAVPELRSLLPGIEHSPIAPFVRKILS